VVIAPAFERGIVGVALRVVSAIEAAGGAYFVGGSVASSFQGERPPCTAKAPPLQ
jgi:hypothetical protein